MSVHVEPYEKNGQKLDHLVVEGIRVSASHGVLPTEKEAKQLFLADVVLHLNTRTAGRSDELDKTVDYSVVADQVAEVLGGEQFELIEAVAEAIAKKLLESHALVAAVDVTVHKPQAPLAIEFADVAVSIRRDVTSGDLWFDKRIGSSAGLADDPLAPGAVPPPADHLDEAPLQPVPVVLALGGNIGNTELTLASAIEDLERVSGIHVTAVSPLVRTKPVGGPEQDDFLNAVVRVDTALSPRSLLQVCQGIEMVHGRERRVVNGPRTLDIDLIQYTGVSGSSEDLVLPHPRAAKRAFVLAPWAAMEPNAELPGGPVATLAASAPDASGLTVVNPTWSPAAVLSEHRSAPAEK